MQRVAVLSRFTSTSILKLAFVMRVAILDWRLASFNFCLVDLKTGLHEQPVNFFNTLPLQLCFC